MSLHPAAEALVRSLQLAPHPEGGFFKETFRSSVRVATPRGERAALTAIHFLLPAGGFSGFHRVSSDEVWHHVQGDPVELHLLDAQGAHTVTVLHASRSSGAVDHLVVPAGVWQAARPVGAAAGYALVSCDVAPGFDFADFELARPEQLLPLAPAEGELLRALCR